MESYKDKECKATIYDWRYGSYHDSMPLPVGVEVSLNPADCSLVRIAENVVAENTVWIDMDAPEVASVRKLKIIVEPYASASIVIRDNRAPQYQNSKVETFETIDIEVGEGAKLDLTEIENTSENNTRNATMNLRQQASSQVSINSFTLKNGVTRNKFYCDFAGEDAGLRLYGGGLVPSTKLSNFSRIAHNVPRCKSDELFKYIVEGNGVGEFEGLIYVAPHAEKTEAYQASRNLVENDESRVYSKPQLEIYNDDVKCSHGCAVGQLDPLQLFYLRTRGIPLEQARRLLRNAFMDDLYAAIADEDLRKYCAHDFE